MNYFEVFDMDIEYEIDLEHLERKYFHLQMANHPDNTSGSAAIDIKLVNAGYLTLKDDEKRAIYLLEMEGYNPEDVKLGHEYLQYIFAISEKVYSGIFSKLEAEKLYSEINKLKTAIKLSFKEEDFKNASICLAKIKYLSEVINKYESIA